MNFDYIDFLSQSIEFLHPIQRQINTVCDPFQAETTMFVYENEILYRKLQS